MKNKDVAALVARLDALFDRISLLPFDPEMQSHWAKYLCVLTSGFIEESVRVICLQYCRKHTNNEVYKYVAGKLGRLQNLSMERIIQLAGEVDNAWAEQVRAKCIGEPKAAVDSIRANRNHIAHGADVGLGFAGMKDYYRGAKRVIEALAAVCE